MVHAVALFLLHFKTPVTSWLRECLERGWTSSFTIPSVEHQWLFREVFRIKMWDVCVQSVQRNALTLRGTSIPKKGIEGGTRHLIAVVEDMVYWSWHLYQNLDPLCYGDLEEISVFLHALSKSGSSEVCASAAHTCASMLY